MAVAVNNMNSLTTLIKRLEAATSRLEDMAQPIQDQAGAANGVGQTSAAPPKEIAGASVKSIEGPSQAAPEVLPESVQDYDTLINTQVSAFTKLSEGLGGVIADQSAGVLKAFNAQRKILLASTKAKKPDVRSPAFMEIFKELQTEMSIVGDIREANRASPFFNHLSAVSEGISALSWITVEPKPADYIGEVLASTQFYGNRVLKEFKEKDQAHVKWIQSFYQIFKSLAALIKQHHPKGLVWNKDGIDAKDAMNQISSAGAASSTAAAAGGSAPPPPPPPPLPNFEMSPPPSAKSTTGDMGSVFQQLNRGESVTSGLRKVDKSEMTHKNPSLRAGSAVPPTRSDSQSSASSISRGKSPVPGKKPKPENMRTKKPPRKELDGNKWVIENFENEREPIEISVQLNQSILISRCNATTLRINGKCNAISLSNSNRLSLIVDDLVSSVDVIKSPNFALQVLGSLPTILLDQVDGATIYLSKSSRETEVFTSKCASINLNVIEGGRGGEDEDFKECPLPEQIKSVLRDGKVVSEIVEHAG